MIQRLSNGRVFDGDRVRHACDVLVERGRIREIVATDAPIDDCEVVDLQGHLVAPGLIDLQINGGGGVLFNDQPDVAALQAIGDAHRAFGTTSFLATLISDSDAVMGTAIAAVSRACSGQVPGVIGIHLEGPHLNAGRKGVHERGQIRSISEQALVRLCSLDTGRTVVTVAPETLPPGTVERLVDAGVVVCGGHSNATYDETRQALEAGLSGFTHLFNAMSGMQSRAPGMVGAALEDPHSFVGIIADGYHVHPAVFAVAVAAKTRGKAVLVSDAMPGVGADATQFELFGETISVASGRCTTADGTLAGSNIGLIEAVINAHKFAGLAITEALRMASTYAADAIGLAGELGYIRPGYRANLVELDDELQVHRTWVDGQRRDHVNAEA